MANDRTDFLKAFKLLFALLERGSFNLLIRSHTGNYKHKKTTPRGGFSLSVKDALLRTSSDACPRYLLCLVMPCMLEHSLDFSSSAV